MTASIAAIILGAVPALAQDASAGTESAMTEPAMTEPAAAEAAAEAAEAGEPVTEAEADLVRDTLGLDIAGADYYALVSWARELGLAETGTAQELRDRLYAHFGVAAPPAAAASSRTITIVSADRTEYLSASGDGESTVLFTGRVSLSVKDDDKGETLTISADSILVNRDANLLSARGDIVFERKKADGSDFFLGDALELDMDDWSGVFLDGESKRGSDTTDEDALFFRADDILKRGSDVLVFKDGVVSSCDDDNPHYSIRASKIWILGGNEWAMQNMTLSVGEIPVLYLPFFYYPGEEIVFHPVFGYEERFGRYVQTTTYILGEKEPKEQEISLLKIAEGSSGYERTIDGVFMRTSRVPKKGTTTDFVKIIVDLYSNLGGFMATQAQVATWGPLQSVVGFAGVGLTRSVFLTSGVYTPFVAATGYESEWNSIDLFGKDVPFRFGWELSSNLTIGPLKVSFSSPFYSDSYFNRDFKDRSENMNWLQFLDQETDDTTISAISSFTDTLSVTASLPESMRPGWLTTANLTKLSSSLSWTAVANAGLLADIGSTLYAVDPGRSFFAPYEWTILDASASLAGTLYKYPAVARASGTAASADAASDSASGPELLSPWAEEDEPVVASSSSIAAADGFLPPPLASAEVAKDREPFQASVGWTWTPTFAWKRRFLSSAWDEPSAVDWSALYETRTVRNAGSLSLSGSVYDGLLGISASVSASSQYQERPRVSSDTAYASTTLLQTWAKQDAQYRNDKLSAALKLTSSPFQDIWLWSPTSVSYSLSSTLYEYAFSSMDPTALTDPSRAIYERSWADWTDDTVTAHALALNLGIKPWGYAQSLTLAADLPPLLEGYSAKLNLKSGWAAMSVSTEYAMPSEDEELAWDPITTSLTVGAAPWPTFTGSFIWDIEDSSPTSVSAALAWEGFSASLAAKEAVAYTLETDGWTATGDAAFRLSAFTIAFKDSWKPPAAWRRRIAWTLDVNANAQQSFLRFTDSYLNFVLGFTLKVHEILDISFASTSKNSALWRYYPGLFEIPGSIEVAPINPFVDLYKSFNFFNTTDREESLFKLKSLSITATHYLHDWDLAMKFSISPVLDGTDYIFQPSLSFTLAWRSVSQIKAAYELEGDEVTWD